MAQVFDGKVYVEPSTGSRVVAQYPPTPIQLGAGTVAVIAESKGGLTANDGVIYDIVSDRSAELSKILRGGVGKNVSSLVFAPSNEYPGAQRVIFVRAQSATRAIATITNNNKDFILESYDKGSYLSDSTNGLKYAIIYGFGGVVSISGLVGGSGYSTGTGVPTTGGSGTGCTVNVTQSGGVITGITIDSAGNGYAVGDVLTVTGGNGNATFVVATVNKIRLQLYLDSVKIYETNDVTNTYLEMKNYLEADKRCYKVLLNSIIIETGGDSQTFSTVTATLFTGGTETSMTQNDILAALDLLRTKDVDIVYLANDGSTLSGAHSAVAAHCVTDAETPRIGVVGGKLGLTKAEAISAASALNSSKMVYVYPGCYLPDPETGVSKLFSPMYTAAMVAGLIAGLAPQIPATYKTLAVQGFEINENDGELVKSQREELIKGGVTFCRFIDGVGFAVNKSITTTLLNEQMINSPSGISREVSIERIKNSLNKDLEIGSKKLFMGGNVNSVSQQDVINYTKAYLQTRCATPTQDNLIIRFESVSARLIDDAWFVDYAFYPNTPINHIFFTGAILKP